MRAACVYLASLALLGCDPGNPTAQINGEAFGTSYRIKIIGKSTVTKKKIDVLLSQLDQELSTWNPDSWVSQFNAAESGSTQTMPTSVQELLTLSEKISAETDGSFDPTAGALIKLWGFGAWEDKNNITPTTAEIDHAKQACGFRHLHIQNDQIKKLHPDLLLDFSAIAKGYAIDQIAALLKIQGHQNFIIEFGGDVFAAGNAPDGKPWQVKRSDTQEIIPLSNQAIATSGSQYHYRDKHSHIINPVTGYPAPIGKSVSVVADSCARADAIATAKYISQPNE